MKLKNKKTGEIIEAVIVDHGAEWGMRNMYTDKEAQIYNSLAELCEDWEDYEEPKEYWYIDCDGEIEDDEYEGTSFDKDCKAIGNYFETKEEAELAVCKLKAWKRLKDKGFGFLGVKGIDYAIDFEVNPPYTHITFDEYTATEEQKEFYNDLMLLFGGEE